MRNPLAVFLFSIDHKSSIVCKIYARIGLYAVIYPFPFEHYCVFCAKTVCDDWWKPKSYFVDRRKELDELKKLVKK